MKLFEMNRTTLVVSLVYALIAYIILRYFVLPGTPLTIYTIIPLGVVIIKILFNHVFKYDHFNDKEEGR